MAKRKRTGDKTRIAVIGGGPKAVALAVRAACLNSELDSRIEVSIFEKSVIAANWDGGHGYTDGFQQLCTNAERDVGFPYSSENVLNVDARIQREFSWSAFKVWKGVYRHWVNRGRPAPPHSEFADYLRFCAKRSGMPLHIGTVDRIRSVGKQWAVESVHGNKRTRLEGFDALVITGHGPQGTHLPHEPSGRVFDGVDFWTRLDEVRALLEQDPDGLVVIAGGGGTGAAIAGWLARQRNTNPILVIGNDASFVARVDNWFENQVFTEKALWSSLSNAARRKFTDRLIRGAVWANVLDEVARSEQLTYRYGKAVSIVTRTGPAGVDEVAVKYKGGPSGRLPATIPCSVAIDATGFNDMWFKPLFSESLQRSLGGRAAIQKSLDKHLRFALPRAGAIHLPMLSQLRSPAFASLMALGEMAADVLQPYERGDRHSHPTV